MRRTLIEHFSWEESAEQGVRGGWVQECASPYLPDHENLRFSNMTSILRHSSAVHPPPPRKILVSVPEQLRTYCSPKPTIVN